MYRGVFFFNDTATTEIYTLSLHDALPISQPPGELGEEAVWQEAMELNFHAARRITHALVPAMQQAGDRKSTRLNSSHANISYAVFCLKKKILNHNIASGLINQH